MNQSLSLHTRTRLVTVNGRKVRAHRYIMEQALGRALLPTEHVHHINKNPLDNRLENLVVMDSAEHMRLHKLVYPTIKNCELCGREFTPNARKRKRQQCCSRECGIKLRTANMAKTRGYAGW